MGLFLIPLTSVATNWRTDTKGMTCSIRSLLSRRLSRPSNLPTIDSLELQATFARTVSKSCNAAMIFVASTIERDSIDAFVFCSRRQFFADCLGSADMTRFTFGRLYFAHLQVRRSGKDNSLRIVDELCIDVQVAAENRQTRPFGCAADLLAQPTMSLLTPVQLLQLHPEPLTSYLPAVLPALVLTTSPRYRTPLPL